MKFIKRPDAPEPKTNFEKFIIILTVFLNFASFVLIVMQLTGVAETMLLYGTLFSVTSFLQAYIDREDDRMYRRHIMYGFLFAAMMVLFSL